MKNELLYFGRSRNIANITPPLPHTLKTRKTHVSVSTLHIRKFMHSESVLVT